MHIAYVDRSGAHAIWRLMDSVAKRQIADGHQVTYVQMDDGRQRDALPPPCGVNHMTLAAPKPAFPLDPRPTRSFRKQFARWCDQQRPDLIHTNFCIPGNTARSVAKQSFQIPVITTCHEMYGSMNPLLRWGVWRTEKYADAIVYISHGVAKSYRPHFDPDENGVDRNDPRHRVIYNGIDVAHIRQVVREAKAKPSPIANSAGPTLISVGRLVPEKGHGTVVAALPQLIRQYPDLRYVILGEGPNRQTLLDQAKKLSVAEHLHLPGWVDHDEAIRRMVAADVIVMPSHSIQEGFGLALAEAMLCVTPIVASRIPVFEEVAGGPSDVLRFFGQGDSGSLAETLLPLLSNIWKTDDFRPLQQRVSDKFDVGKMSRAYAELYAEVLDR
ncbi:glycosyltransferase [Crateriforma conspicua]|uniref:glycosyltransferase n=1 Tax=Crateriforma conspicua TaxID=2527996 RepID=UPI0011881EE4|nr:glycosyltransferase [Crateriforma conspicua]QDV65941.1 Glycogen synthase [Crateriforma conspicua]